MTLDRASFIQGLITGLKLPRTPGGRQPPPPSQMYILAEDGTPIITEGLQVAPVTAISMMGVREFAATSYVNGSPDAEIADYGTERLSLRDRDDSHIIYNAPDVHLFWANITDGVFGDLVYWVTCIDERSISRYQNCEISGSYRSASFDAGWSLPFTNLDQWLHAGNLYYTYWSTINARPTNSTLFTGTKADLQTYLSTAPFSVTNFMGDEWYPYSRYDGYGPDAAVIDTGFYAKRERARGNTPNYFMWHDTANNRLWQIWWAYDPAYINSGSFYLYRHRLGEQYAVETTGTSPDAARQAGDVWYYAHASYYRPDNAEAFSGTLAELEAYLAGWAGRNMITE